MTEFTDRTAGSDADLLAAIERLENAEPAPESAVERVAAAICRSDFPDESLADQFPEWQQLYRDRATAAIDAMRGPDQGAAIGRVLALADEIENEATDGTKGWETLATLDDVADRLRAALDGTR